MNKKSRVFWICADVLLLAICAMAIHFIVYFSGDIVREITTFFIAFIIIVYLFLAYRRYIANNISEVFKSENAFKTAGIVLFITLLILVWMILYGFLYLNLMEEPMWRCGKNFEIEYYYVTEMMK